MDWFAINDNELRQFYMAALIAGGGDTVLPVVNEIRLRKITYSESTNGAEKRIYDHWNKVSPIKHRKLTDGMKKNIKSKLKEYKEEELIQCIDNYVKVVMDAACWYKYRSALDEFFRPGVQKPAPCMKFLPDRFVYNNFINRNGKQSIPPGGSRII